MQTTNDKLGSQRSVIVTNPWKIYRFWGTSEPPVREWISDIKAHIATRRGIGSLYFRTPWRQSEESNSGSRIHSWFQPKAIFEILLNVFGDGDTFAQLQHKFFSYRQSENKSLLICSLELVNIFAQINGIDESWKGIRDKTLQEYFSEAVLDEAVQREVRRLNNDAPHLSFFEIRDHWSPLHSRKAVLKTVLW